MGMFQVPIKISNPKNHDLYFEEHFWIDTGASYNFIPEDRLTAIGIEPLHSRDLLLAEGRRDRRLLGEALVTIHDLNETFTCPVIFAPKESLYMLGATVLENVGVDADPTEKKLKPILGIIGGFIGSKQSNKS